MVAYFYEARVSLFCSLAVFLFFGSFLLWLFVRFMLAVLLLIFMRPACRHFLLSCFLLYFRGFFVAVFVAYFYEARVSFCRVESGRVVGWLVVGWFVVGSFIYVVRSFVVPSMLPSLPVDWNVTPPSSSILFNNPPTCMHHTVPCVQSVPWLLVCGSEQRAACRQAGRQARQTVTKGGRESQAGGESHREPESQASERGPLKVLLPCMRRHRSP